MSGIQHMTPKTFELVKKQRATIDRIRDKAKEQATRATHSAIVAGTAAGLGYAAKRYDRTEVGGAKVSLLVAVAGHTAALVGPSAYADMAAAAGDGGLAVMAYEWGLETGQRHKNESNGVTVRK